MDSTDQGLYMQLALLYHKVLSVFFFENSTKIRVCAICQWICNKLSTNFLIQLQQFHDHRNETQAHSMMYPYLKCVRVYVWSQIILRDMCVCASARARQGRVRVCNKKHSTHRHWDSGGFCPCSTLLIFSYLFPQIIVFKLISKSFSCVLVKIVGIIAIFEREQQKWR